MIAYKVRDGKRGRPLKMSRQLERLYKEGKCRDCSVVVTRMDFAKILGKFTKVKIQYESSSTTKSPKGTDTPSPNSNARLKSNENGMVLIHRNAYSQHPVKELVSSKKPKNRQISSTRQILKENNVPKSMSMVKDKKNNIGKQKHSNINNNKQYAIIFNDPSSKNNIDMKCDLTITDLLPNIDNRILPSEDWCIDYFPKNQEPTDDKVYDRIAAELEDLMYNEKSEIKYSKSDNTESKSDNTESKSDEFPSIMDILNDNTTPISNPEPKDNSNSIEFKTNLESSDVEAMLLGKADDNKIDESTPMEVDSTDVNKLIQDVVQFNSSVQMEKKDAIELNEIENPHSPSILDEALQKGIEEHLPNHNSPLKDDITINNNVVNDISKLGKPKESAGHDKIDDTVNSEETLKPLNGQSVCPAAKIAGVTHVVFKKVINGVCQKTVTCPKNLKYSIEIEERSVEFLGAPKYILSLEDLQVLLQIVHETDLKSLYIYY